MKEEIFVLSVSGYEGYSPTWFRARRSQDDFERIVKEAIHNVTPALIKKDEEFGYSFIGGHDVKKFILPILNKEGFKVITPRSEIDLMGDCLYNKGQND